MANNDNDPGAPPSGAPPKDPKAIAGKKDPTLLGPILPIDAVQEACVASRARLVHMPEAPDVDSKHVVIELQGGRVIEMPVPQFRSDKLRDIAVKELVEKIRKASK